MRKLEYRHPRKTSIFNIEFLVDGVTIHGVCKDVSEDGVRAGLDRHTAVGTLGLLKLRHPMRVLTINARLSYLDKAEVGFAFLFEESQEREAATEFVAMLSARPGPPLAFRRA